MEHRCGKHIVLANPASRVPIWTECAVHRSPGAQVETRFMAIVQLEFFGEEILQLDWIVRHAMLD